jgi:hypothetical protein
MRLWSQQELFNCALCYLEKFTKTNTRTKSTKESQMYLSQIMKTHSNRVERIEQERQFAEIIQPNSTPEFQTTLKLPFPTNKVIGIEFISGEIVSTLVIQDTDDVKSAIEWIEDGSYRIAVDFEWKPEFMESDKNPIILFQFCSSKGALIIRHDPMHPGNAILKKFLQSRRFVGKGCQYDHSKLKEKFGEDIGIEIIDIEQVEGVDRNIEQKVEKLQGEPVFAFKSKTISISNWEAKQLSTVQILYAAFDVVALLNSYRGRTDSGAKEVIKVRVKKENGPKEQKNFTKGPKELKAEVPSMFNFNGNHRKARENEEAKGPKQGRKQTHSPPHADVAIEEAKVFVGGINPNATKVDVLHAFKGFGRIKSISIIKPNAHKMEGRRFGHRIGFVEFYSPHAVQSALSWEEPIIVKGVQVSVATARQRVDTTDSE